MVVKNTFGCSAVLGSKSKKSGISPRYSGSSLDRKKNSDPKPEKQEVLLREKHVEDETQEKTWVMSSRSKSKIRKKILAFAQLHKRLTFTTLTFVNEVSDKEAIRILGKFIDNNKKRKQSFSYIWVAERQNLNKLYPGNIHFHMLSNIFWNIQGTWAYWIELQAKNGIKPREEHFRPSSAFDVKQVHTHNTKGLGAYLTKYVTKNNDVFKCQVWNCSKDISALYTDFYTGYEFLEEVHRLKGDEIKEVPLEFCTLHLIPLDKTTMRFYERLRKKNAQTIKAIKK